ncbi:thrombospondin type 3 repeat-containing protein [Motiliproteus sp. SC1-56]|uniref:thrombospondin type 3 repeat-containing protein n=1 Tax=Motiliproteus sp. SC1-56 TaxID=2799565 RepID=UPI001F5DE2ED|nr:thrombospondin type 3 repeat-containing protein [Motiliproteus sp. SC1-56]
MKRTNIYAVILTVMLSLFGSANVYAVAVTIDTGNYTGLWDMDIDGQFRSGTAVVDLDPGVHRFRPGTTGLVIFSVDEAGMITLPPDFDGVSAIGGSGVLSILTLPVVIDPGQYAGLWEIGRVTESVTGLQTVNLVPSNHLNFNGSIGNAYRVAVGLQSSAFLITLLGDGTVNVFDSTAASGAAGALSFANTDVSVIDRNSISQAWYILQVTEHRFGDATVTLVPELTYVLRDVAAGLGIFTVSEPCAVSPTSLTLSGVDYDLSCGAIDQDSDGVPDVTDNCPLVANPDQIDIDGDGAGDSCDVDDDGDGVEDTQDNCPQDPNPAQSDADLDGIGDACDGDSDGDGVDDQVDLCPLSPPSLPVDLDGCTGAQRIARACDISNFVQHGKYVNCVAHAANESVALGLINETEKSLFIKEAAKRR